MKFNFKNSAIAAMLALSASGHANAGIDPDQIVFYAYNGSVDSVMFDLGLNLSNIKSITDSITWNLSSGTVTGSLPGGASVDFGSVWSSFSFGATSRWGVIGADAGLGDAVSTTAADLAVVESTTGTQLTESSVDTTTVYMNQHNFLGTHPDVDNGASRATELNALHFNGFGAGDRWQQRFPFQAGLTGSGDLPVYYIAYSEPTGTVTELGKFSFDAANATLVYQPLSQPIPEPGTYALMGVGLLALGAVARRRARG